jgi:hypothetical protein
MVSTFTPVRLDSSPIDKSFALETVTGDMPKISLNL